MSSIFVLANPHPAGIVASLWPVIPYKINILLSWFFVVNFSGGHIRNETVISKISLAGKDSLLINSSVIPLLSSHSFFLLPPTPGRQIYQPSVLDGFWLIISAAQDMSCAVNVARSPFTLTSSLLSLFTDKQRKK